VLQLVAVVAAARPEIEFEAAHEIDDLALQLGDRGAQFHVFALQRPELVSVGGHGLSGSFPDDPCNLVPDVNQRGICRRRRTLLVCDIFVEWILNSRLGRVGVVRAAVMPSGDSPMGNVLSRKQQAIINIREPAFLSFRAFRNSASPMPRERIVAGATIVHQNPPTRDPEPRYDGVDGDASERVGTAIRGTACAPAHRGCVEHGHHALLAWSGGICHSSWRQTAHYRPLSLGHACGEIHGNDHSA
jgi:hypothetical protein